MNFGLLVSHLPRQLPQSFSHSDAALAQRSESRAPSRASPLAASALAARWRNLKARVFVR